MSPTQQDTPAYFGSVRQTAGRWVCAFDGVGQPSLRVLCSHDAESPESASSDEVPGFAHHWVAGVRIRHHELSLVCTGKCDQFLRLLLGEHHRLLTHDIDALLEECLGHRKVDVVGNRDDDEVNLALGACSLLDGHVMEIGICTVNVDAEVLRDLDRLRRNVGETSGNQLRLVVHCDSGAMHRADGRPWSPAYLPIQEAGSCLVQLAFNHVISPFPEESICACTGPSPISIADGVSHTTYVLPASSRFWPVTLGQFDPGACVRTDCLCSHTRGLCLSRQFWNLSSHHGNILVSNSTLPMLSIASHLSRQPEGCPARGMNPSHVLDSGVSCGSPVHFMLMSFYRVEPTVALITRVSISSCVLDILRVSSPSSM